MISASINRLTHLCQTIPALMLNIPEGEFTNKPAPEKWSRKEILGHLLDSATNNHQRFVRSQFEDAPSISYTQNNWVNYSNYNSLNSKLLISFWATYNKFIVELMNHISPENLKKECNSGGEKNETIEWLFNDYVTHLEHHLKQIVEYE